MQKVILQARPHHSCVPCKYLPREDDYDKRTLKVETIVSVNIRPMKPVSRAQKDHDEVGRINRSGLAYII